MQMSTTVFLPWAAALRLPLAEAVGLEGTK